jgi:phosphocarrier protein
MPTNKNNRQSKEVIVTNELGIHARSAAKLSEIAQKAFAKVWIIKDDQRADASSILDVLTLMCIKDTQIAIEIEDQKDTEILDAIVALIEDGFGE